MNDILDLPPALEDNPNKKRALLIFFSIAMSGLIWRALHLPIGSLLRIFGFGILSGYTLTGLRENFHPKTWFRISLLVCALWLILAVLAWQLDPEDSINGYGILVYLGVTLLSHVIFQARHYIRKIRANNRPDDSHPN